MENEKRYRTDKTKADRSHYITLKPYDEIYEYCYENNIPIDEYVDQLFKNAAILISLCDYKPNKDEQHG
jgi:hypothetical protein